MGYAVPRAKSRGGQGGAEGGGDYIILWDTVVGTAHITGHAWGYHARGRGGGVALPTGPVVYLCKLHFRLR